jgi:hypothetical protein
MRTSKAHLIKGRFFTVCFFFLVKLAGKAPKIKLYKDEQGRLKGDARVAFLKVLSLSTLSKT